MADQAPHIEQAAGFQSSGAGYYLEPPELMASNISVGVRLLCGALLSFFGAFLFTYLYLKETDAGAVWRPGSVEVPLGSGIAILACVLASALLTALGRYLLPGEGIARWRIVAILSEALALAALGIQCYQWAALDFGPTSAPYASIFIAWTGFYAGVGLLSAIYWMHTTIASAIRHAGSEPGPLLTVEGAGEGLGAKRSLFVRIEPEVRSFAFLWYFLAAVQIVTFVLLYIVA